jgi:DHA1 family bicyclomycin/chloramphenicol resistance-like MFS transporter
LEEKPLFIGLLVYILASLGCAFVSDIDTFIGLRFTSGRQLCRYGSCYRNGSRFVSRKIPKVLSLLMLVVGLSCFYWRLRNSGLWMARCFLNFNGYWYCGSIGLSFWLATYDEPDTSISLKPKPILNFLERDERTSVLYLCTGGSFLWVIHVRRGLYSFGCFKVDATTYGWILPLCL